jgi:hypothetical protein
MVLVSSTAAGVSSVPLMVMASEAVLVSPSTSVRV